MHINYHVDSWGQLLSIVSFTVMSLYFLCFWIFNAGKKTAYAEGRMHEATAVLKHDALYQLIHVLVGGTYKIYVLYEVREHITKTESGMSFSHPIHVSADTVSFDCDAYERIGMLYKARVSYDIKKDPIIGFFDISRPRSVNMEKK